MKIRVTGALFVTVAAATGVLAEPPAVEALLAMQSAGGTTTATSQTATDRRVADAVKARDRNAVVRLLDARADVNGRQPDGATALHWAAHWNDLETARLLLRRAADVNASNDHGATPLQLACTNGSTEMVQALLEARANPNAALRSGETPLMTAARSGNAAIIDLLAAAGATIDARESTDAQTALMWAAAEKQAAVAHRLLAHGAGVNERSKSGSTPILFAARTGDVEIAKLLLAAGAKVNDTARDGSTPLLVAAVRGRVDLARFLLENGADPNADGPGYTALHWAAGGWETELTGSRGIIRGRDDEWDALGGLYANKVELLRALLSWGADPNARVMRPPPRVGFTVFRVQVLVGASPFFLAAFAADAPAMRVLANWGADPHLTNNERTTPLMAAAGVGRQLAETRTTLEGSLDAAKVAVELGNDVNATNNAGDTPLHGAAHTRSNALVQFLFDKGATLDVANKRGETPLSISERTLTEGSAPTNTRTSTGDLLRKLGATATRAPR
jgi:ankyrin repeat protein